MRAKIVAISDAHYAPDGNCKIVQRRGEIADILLLRAVHRINRFIRPDITLILGDICDKNTSGEGLERMRGILNLLKSPWLIIPGNHDGSPESFYSVFPRPPETTDLNGIRFAPFLDPEEPGYNARRTGQGLARMRAIRSDWDGKIIMLQHTPLFPPGRMDCHYNYVNAGEIIAAMRQNGIFLSLSGHYHNGFDLVRDEGMNFLTSPALCEAPFTFLEIEIMDEDIKVKRHDLRLPEKLNLWDMHVHTQFAYCSENMDVAKNLKLSRDFGLAGLTFMEHSGQLYFDRDTYWKYAFLDGGFAAIKKENERMDAYLAALSAAGCRPENIGLEADCSFDGVPFVRPEDRRRVRYLIGSVHSLPSLRNKPPDTKKVHDEFLAMTGNLARSGIDILAHPFRTFFRAKLEVPESLYDAVIGLLRENKLAAEINFHTQETDREFVRRCIASGVKLALGSDAHNLYEIGEFSPHLALLRECGAEGDLSGILFTPRTSTV